MESVFASASAAEARLPVNVRANRIMKEIQDFFSNAPQDIQNIHLIPDKEDIGQVYVLIRGPDRTPYQGGFFFMTIKFPEEYPWSPPTVQLMTTAKGTVALNPVFTRDGQIKLNILDQDWCPALTLGTVLLSILSLLNDNPYFMPGSHYFMDDKTRILSEQYNDWAMYETMRVAVIGMLDSHSTDAQEMPRELRDVMVSYFRSHYYYYENQVILEMKYNDFSRLNPAFKYRTLLENLLTLKKHYNILDTTDQSLPEIWSQTRAQIPVPPTPVIYEPEVESYQLTVEKVLSTIPKPEDILTFDELVDDDGELEEYEDDITDLVNLAANKINEVDLSDHLESDIEDMHLYDADVLSDVSTEWEVLDNDDD